MNEGTLLVFLGMTAVAALLALGTVLFRKGRTEDEARAYLAGVHYVLSDDPDAAIAELSKAARLNTQTYETYFALAALFRRKGELAWAIRLSQNILLKPGLNLDVRRRAQLELALDYRRSGLKDQSVEAFEKLLLEEPGHAEALLRYRQTLEETRDLPRAIELQEKLIALQGSGEDVLAHLLAERVQDVLSTCPEAARALAERAVALAPGSAHAQLALAQVRLELADDAGEKALAAEPLQRAITLEPELAALNLPLLTEALGSSEAVEAWLLKAKQDRAEGMPFDFAVALCHRDRPDARRAIEMLRAIVAQHPDSHEARRELGALLLQTDQSDELRRDYIDILGTLGRPALAFGCSACGQKLSQHAFRCTFCGAWDTVRRELPAVAVTLT